MDLSGNPKAPAGNKDPNIERQLEILSYFREKLEQSQEEAAEADDAAALNEQKKESGPPTKKRKKKSPTSTGAPVTFALVPITPVAVKPSKDLTGVEPYVTSICATISLQIYEATADKSFDLIDKNDETVAAEVMIFDNHDILKDLVPPFAVAVSGDIMILAWRGSTTIMDWASDFSASPVTSSRWSPIAPHVKAHSGYVSLVESELGIHEKKLIEIIKDKSIKQLVTTGHSLAGGMAQVSHVFLEGQLQQDGSKWNKLLGHLTVRSIGFAAPMTIMNTMDLDNPDTQTTIFLRTIAENSCNIVYGPDVVPHAYGDTDYLLSLLKAVATDVVANVVPQCSWVLHFPCIASKLSDMIAKFEKNNGELLKVMMKYNHIGKIIYYANRSATPVALNDTEFRANVKVREKSTGLSVQDQLAEAHDYFPRALAYNVRARRQTRE